MDEILILSGKGGTGKTSVAAALATLSETAAIADLDVDAANLAFLLDAEKKSTETFISGVEAAVNPDTCRGCGRCAKFCRFDALEKREDGTYTVRETACEGCGLCAEVCPADAVTLSPRECGEWYMSETPIGPLVHAELNAGGENSGKLVAHLRYEIKKITQNSGFKEIIMDGAPGVGCPVISAMGGVDFVVLVTESSPAGLHDLKRIYTLCEYFSVPAGVVINRADINPAITDDIRTWTARKALPFLGEIRWNPAFGESMKNGESVIGYDPAIDRALRHIHREMRTAISDNRARK